MTRTDQRREDEMKQGLELMQTLRDEVRLQIHLAGMEAKDEWSRLEPVLAEIERTAATMTEAAHHGLHEALDRLKTLRSSLGHAGATTSARS